MPVIGIEGGLGTGKTVYMTRLLYLDSKKGFPVMSNYKLMNVKHEMLDVSNVLEMNESNVQLKNMSIGIDEITVFMDCRRAMSNLMISYFILQSRKRNVNIYYTTQSFDMVDNRLIDHTDFQVMCSKIYNKNGSEIKDYRRYCIFDMRNLRDIHESIFNLKISSYYKYYDTNEVILPPIRQKKIQYKKVSNVVNPVI